MPTDTTQDIVADLVPAGRDVIDSFGHASVRHPDRYLLPRVRAAELVTLDDILEFDFDDQPQPASDARVFAERCIHSAIYRARPDVTAVCHHHAPEMMPFCVSGIALRTREPGLGEPLFSIASMIARICRGSSPGHAGRYERTGCTGTDE